MNKSVVWMSMMLVMCVVAANAAPPESAGAKGKGKPVADPAKVQPVDIKPVVPAQPTTTTAAEDIQAPPAVLPPQASERAAAAVTNAAQKKAEGAAKAAEKQASGDVKAAEKQAAKDPTGKPGKRVGWWRRWFGGGSSESE